MEDIKPDSAEDKIIERPPELSEEMQRMLAEAKARLDTDENTRNSTGWAACRGLI